MRKIMQVTGRNPEIQLSHTGFDGLNSAPAHTNDPFDDSEQSIQQLLAKDYQKAYIDLALSNARLAKRYGIPEDDVAGPAFPALPLVSSRLSRQSGRYAALKDELLHAARLHDAAVNRVREIMALAVQGRFHAEKADEAVEGLVSSLERNPDALLFLSSTRQRAPYTYTHCVNVAVLLAAFALQAGKKRATVLNFGIAGLLHDVGKAMLPVSLLSARRKLSETEISLMQRHPAIAHDFLASFPGVCAEALRAALEHHERYDGSGYPRGLSRDAISDIGHLAGIADTYDAISSRRPFKGALHPHKSLGVMYQMRLKHFHPLLVERFVRMVGVYPVGSVVELADGYKGVVVAGNPENPVKPVVVLALDPQGRAMRLHEVNLAEEPTAAITRCIPAELSGLDPCALLGVMD